MGRRDDEPDRQHALQRAAATRSSRRTTRTSPDDERTPTAQGAHRLPHALAAARDVRVPRVRRRRLPSPAAERRAPRISCMLWKRRAAPERCRRKSKGPIRAQLKPDGKGRSSAGQAAGPGASRPLSLSSRTNSTIHASILANLNARALPPHSVLHVHLQLLQLQPRAVRAGLKDRYVAALEREIRGGGQGRSRRHDLLRRRHAVAARAGRDRAADRRVPRGVRRHGRRRDHARDQSRDVDARADGTASARPVSTASASASSRSGTRSCGGSAGCIRPIARARRSSRRGRPGSTTSASI